MNQSHPEKCEFEAWPTELVFEAPSLVVLSGPSGVGKSTFAKRLFEREAYIVSTDAIREELRGDVNNVSNREEILDEAAFRAALHFELRDTPAVIDFTGQTPDDRQRFTEVAGIYGVPAYLVVLDAHPQVLEKGRNLQGRQYDPEGLEESFRMMLINQEATKKMVGRGEYRSEGFVTATILPIERAQLIQKVQFAAE